jgi:transcriptional regulator with XRE-family HTH domain
MSTGMIDTERLQKAMDEAGLDQSGLARLLDVTPGTVNQILTGRTKRSRYMPAIAQQLNVSLSWLTRQSESRLEKAGAQLSDEERRLLASWRRLSWDQRDVVQRLLDTMLPTTVHSDRHAYRAR